MGQALCGGEGTHRETATAWIPGTHKHRPEARHGMGREGPTGGEGTGGGAQLTPVQWVWTQVAGKGKGYGSPSTIKISVFSKIVISVYKNAWLPFYFTWKVSAVGKLQYGWL